MRNLKATEAQGKMNGLDNNLKLPRLPKGVSIKSWQPREAPFRVLGVGTISSTADFLSEKFGQLRAALRGERSWALTGNWPVQTLVQHLEAAGVTVVLDEKTEAMLRRRANLALKARLRARRKNSDVDPFIACTIRRPVLRPRARNTDQ